MTEQERAAEIQAIRDRHSVRTYTSAPIEQDKLNALTALADQINRETGLHLQVLADAGDSFHRMLHKLTGLGTAPAVIACVGPDNGDLDELAGYHGERLVLLAQRLGLNTCWVGMYRKDGVPAQVNAGERLSIVIALGYGASQGKPHRSRTPAQVTDAATDQPDWFRNGVELALLAPTAMNQQHFLITLKADGAVEITDKGGPYSRVDLGIVKYHFDVGSAH